MHPVETNLFGEWRGPKAKKRETKSEKPTKNRSCSQSKLVKIMVCVVRSATRMSQAKYANEPVVSRITRFHLDVLAVPRANWIGDWAAWGTCGNGTLARLRQPNIRQRFKRRESYRRYTSFLHLAFHCFGQANVQCIACPRFCMRTPRVRDNDRPCLFRRRLYPKHSCHMDSATFPVISNCSGPNSKMFHIHLLLVMSSRRNIEQWLLKKWMGPPRANQPPWCLSRGVAGVAGRNAWGRALMFTLQQRAKSWRNPHLMPTWY